MEKISYFFVRNFYNSAYGNAGKAIIRKVSVRNWILNRRPEAISGRVFYSRKFDHIRKLRIFPPDCAARTAKIAIKVENALASPAVTYKQGK